MKTVFGQLPGSAFRSKRKRASDYAKGLATGFLISNLIVFCIVTVTNYQKHKEVYERLNEIFQEIERRQLEKKSGTIMVQNLVLSDGCPILSEIQITPISRWEKGKDHA